MKNRKLLGISLFGGGEPGVAIPLAAVAFVLLVAFIVRLLERRDRG